MIINADDFGYSKSVNEAICECFKRGLINRTTVMVNMPAFDEAVKIAKENDFFGAVGLHINLTEGKALSALCQKSSLCDEKGYFKGTFHVPVKSRLYLNKEVRGAIYAEVQAQIEKYISAGFTLMHADSHNYTHVYISVFKCIDKLLKKYGFKSVRISRNVPENDFSLPFKIYKDLFNFGIKRMKINGEVVKTTKYFASVQDFEKTGNMEKYKHDIELMTHPDFVDGVLTDKTLPNPHPFKDEEWIKCNNLHIEDVTGKKQKLLVCFIQAHIGGAMTALVNFLNELDTEKYDVDLLFYEHKGERYGIKDEINILPQGKIHKSLSFKNIAGKVLSPSYVIAKIRETYYTKVKHNAKAGLQVMSKEGYKYSAKIDKKYDAAIAFELSWALNYVVNKVDAKKKLVWFHNDFVNAGFIYKIDKKAFDRADALVFVSEDCRQSFIKKHPVHENKAYFVPNLLSVDYLRKKGEEEITLPFEDNGELKFLSVARVNFEEKGFDRAAKVFARLKTENLLTNVKWIVVGKGHDSKQFEEMIKEYNLEDVIFPVGVKKNPVPYMKKSDILFLPSRHEGRPMVVTEGFIMNLVPVVTKYTSANEQIRHGFDGLVFENSEEGLYNGLRELLTNKTVLDELKKNVQNTHYGNESEISKFYDMMEKISQ